MHIGDYVRRERRKIGLTQKQICELSNIKQSTLASIERGVINPSVRTLATLYAVLGEGLLEYFKDSRSS